MGGPLLCVVLVILLSDSVSSHGVRRIGAAPGEAEAVKVPVSHGSVEKFESSPALGPLQYGSPNALGDHGGSANTQRPAYPAEDMVGESNHPVSNSEDHPPFHAEAAAQLAKSPFGEPSSQPVKHTIRPTQFHPTHSFFGCMFFGGCPDYVPESSLPSVGVTTKATGSFTSGPSEGSNTSLADELRLPTPTGQALAEHTTEGALRNGTKPPKTVTDATVHHSTVSTPSTRGSPPVDNLRLAQTATTEGLRQRASTLTHAATIGTEVSQSPPIPPSSPDMPRWRNLAPGTIPSEVFASTAATTLAENSSKSTLLLSTTPTSEGVEAAHSTQGSAPSTAPFNNSKLPPSVPPIATIGVLPRQGLQENATEVAPSGQTRGLTTRRPMPAFNDTDRTVKPTPSAESSTTVRREESFNPLPLPTQASKNAPLNSTPGTDPSTLTTVTVLSRRRTEITPSPKIASSDSTASRQLSFGKQSSDLPTASAMQFSEAPQRPLLNETTTQPLHATTTPGLTPTGTASPLTPTATEGQTEANSSHPVLRVVPTEAVRQAVNGSTTLGPDEKPLSETLERTATSLEVSSTNGISLQQTRPSSRPVLPPTSTTRPTTLHDSYVRPITQHSTDQFVPDHKGIEDYYTVHLPGRIGEFENQRLGQCGKCQRRLHNCVQKCFLHHSCEAENTELSCPRINAPCMPPFKHEVDQCRHTADCDGANHLCCLVGCSRRCILGVSPSHHWTPRP